MSDTRHAISQLYYQLLRPTAALCTERGLVTSNHTCLLLSRCSPLIQRVLRSLRHLCLWICLENQHVKSLLNWHVSLFWNLIKIGWNHDFQKSVFSNHNCIACSRSRPQINILQISTDIYTTTGIYKGFCARDGSFPFPFGLENLMKFYFWKLCT